MKTGIQLIEAERIRQIQQEGWTPEHDDQHCVGELAAAASCYASFAATSAKLSRYSARKLSPPVEWPWEREWWKPSATVSDLVKAGALIAAEIDRIQRKPVHA